MSRTYWRVASAFWSDEKVIGAGGCEPWTDDMKMLALYLLTCEHRTAEGMFRLPKGYILEDLGWDAKRLAKPFAQLLENGFIDYDERAKIILIVNALEYQSPENPNQVTAAIKLLEELPETPLFARLYAQAEAVCKRFAEGLAERFPERLAEGYAKPLSPPPPLSPKTFVRPAATDESEFKEFYALYPKHEGRGQAEKAYRGARKKAPADTILAALRAQLPELSGRDRQFIPLPATWLNGERWLDDQGPPGKESREVRFERLKSSVGESAARMAVYGNG